MYLINLRLQIKIKHKRYNLNEYLLFKKKKYFFLHRAMWNSVFDSKNSICFQKSHSFNNNSNNIHITGWKRHHHHRCKQLQLDLTDIGISQSYMDMARSRTSCQKGLQVDSCTAGLWEILYCLKSYCIFRSSGGTVVHYSLVICL